MATSTTSRSSSVKKRTTRKPVPPKKSKPSPVPLSVVPEAAKTRSKVAKPIANVPASGKTATQTKAGGGKKKMVKQKSVRTKPQEKTKSKPQRAQLALAMTATGVNPGVKAKRARVPKDFAEQYSEKTKKRRRTKAHQDSATQTKRRDAAARERLRQLMMPTDDVVRRLAQAGAIAASVLLTDEGVPSATARRRSTATGRRPRRWETRCGKCGTNGQFKAAAGLCSRCGAIVVRDGIGA